MAEPPRRTNCMVHYHSTALETTAPELTALVDPRLVQDVPAVIEANRMAETVREEFKRKRARGNEAEELSGVDSEEAKKAGRYDRRLKMNRHSAAASRVRREAYIKALESMLYNENIKFEKLQRELDAEKQTNKRLRQGNVQPDQQPPSGEDDSAPISDVSYVDPLTIPEPEVTEKLTSTEQISDDAGLPVLPPDPSTEVSVDGIDSLFSVNHVPFLNEPAFHVTESGQLDLDAMFPETTTD